MRILYIISKVTIGYALFFFYRRRKFVNEPKYRFGRTIFVSNHSASFMDPISIGSLTRPIVFFMTRSDVFTPVTKPILWACHMLPIYRQRDGVDTKEKNKESFRKSSQVLKNGRNLLIFGEGETYDVFVRRLKPLKKGAIRMGFIALESMNWKKKVNVVALGVNYAEPNRMRSDFLIAYSESFCLNDYRKEYEENPNKTITDLTKKVEDLMKQTVTHVENPEYTTLHENIMMITRKGINPISFDPSIDLIERWNYSRKLADWINAQDDSNNTLRSLLNSSKNYQEELATNKVNDDEVFLQSHNVLKSKRKVALVYLIGLFPFMILGLIHSFIPYILAKRFAEKKFKRQVFWGSVKMVTGMILMGLYNIPFIFLFHEFIYANYWVAMLYYILVPFMGLSAWIWFDSLSKIKRYRELEGMELSKLTRMRSELENQIQSSVTI